MSIEVATERGDLRLLSCLVSCLVRFLLARDSPSDGGRRRPSRESDPEPWATGAVGSEARRRNTSMWAELLRGKERQRVAAASKVDGTSRGMHRDAPLR